MRDIPTKPNQTAAKAFKTMRYVLSLFCSLLLVSGGCNARQEAHMTAATDANDSQMDELLVPSMDFDVHPSAGPHDGLLIELGEEEYHAELVYNQDVVTIYVLDHSARSACCIAERDIRLNLLDESGPVQYRLPAAPQNDDEPGRSSRFELQDAQLVRLLERSAARPRLNIMVAGKAYRGIIQR